MALLTDVLGGVSHGLSTSSNSMAQVSNANLNIQKHKEGQKDAFAQGLSRQMLAFEQEAVAAGANDDESRNNFVQKKLFSTPGMMEKMKPILNRFITTGELREHNEDIAGVDDWKITTDEKGAQYLTPMVVIDEGWFSKDSKKEYSRGKWDGKRVVPMTLAGTADSKDVPLKIPVAAAYEAMKNEATMRGGYTNVGLAMDIVGDAPNALGEMQGKVVSMAKEAHKSTLPQAQQNTLTALEQDNRSQRAAKKLKVEAKEAKADLGAAMRGEDTSKDTPAEGNEKRSPQLLKLKQRQLEKSVGTQIDQLDRLKSRLNVDPYNIKVAEEQIELTKTRLAELNKEIEGPTQIGSGYQLAVDKQPDQPDESEEGKIEAGIAIATDLVMKPDATAEERTAAAEQRNILIKAQKGNSEGNPQLVKPEAIVLNSEKGVKAAEAAGKGEALGAQSAKVLASGKYPPTARAAAYARMSIMTGITPSNEIMANLLAGDNARGDYKTYLDLISKQATATSKLKGAAKEMATANAKFFNDRVQERAKSYSEAQLKRMGFDNADAFASNVYEAITNSVAKLKIAEIPSDITRMSQHDTMRIIAAVEKTLGNHGDEYGGVNFLMAKWGEKVLDTHGSISNRVIPAFMEAHVMMDELKKNDPDKYEALIVEQLSQYGQDKDPHEGIAQRFVEQKLELK